MQEALGECVVCLKPIDSDDVYLLAECNKCSTSPYHTFCVTRVLERFSREKGYSKKTLDQVMHKTHFGSFRNVPCQRAGCGGFVLTSHRVLPAKEAKGPAIPPPLRAGPAPRRALGQAAAAPPVPQRAAAAAAAKQQRAAAAVAVQRLRKEPAGGGRQEPVVQRPSALQLCPNVEEMGRCYEYGCPRAHSQEELASRRAAASAAAAQREDHERRQLEEDESFSLQLVLGAHDAGSSSSEASSYMLAARRGDGLLPSGTEPAQLTEAALDSLRSFKRSDCIASLQEMGFDEASATEAAAATGCSTAWAATLLSSDAPVWGSRPVDVSQEAAMLSGLSESMGLDRWAVEGEIFKRGGDLLAAAEGLQRRAAAVGSPAGSPLAPAGGGGALGGPAPDTGEVQGEEEGNIAEEGEGGWSGGGWDSTFWGGEAPAAGVQQEQQHEQDPAPQGFEGAEGQDAQLAGADGSVRLPRTSPAPAAAAAEWAGPPTPTPQGDAQHTPAPSHDASTSPPSWVQTPERQSSPTAARLKAMFGSRAGPAPPVPMPAMPGSAARPSPPAPAVAPRATRLVPPAAAAMEPPPGAAAPTFPPHLSVTQPPSMGWLPPHVASQPPVTQAAPLAAHGGPHLYDQGFVAGVAAVAAALGIGTAGASLDAYPGAGAAAYHTPPPPHQLFPQAAFGGPPVGGPPHQLAAQESYHTPAGLPPPPYHAPLAGPPPPPYSAGAPPQLSQQPSEGNQELSELLSLMGLGQG